MKVLVIFSIFALIYKTQAVCDKIWSFDCHKDWTELKDDSPPNVAVKNLQIARGSLPIVSLELDLCKYSSIEKLLVENVGLQSTKASALAKCTDLKVVKIIGNALGDGIHRDTFKENSGLEEIWLQENKISSLHEGTFNHLTNLKVLDLGGNELQHFSPALVQGLTKLRLLALYSNNIEELNGVAINKNLPALDYVYFNDNPLKCDDVDKLIDAFPTAEVSAYAAFAVKRNYEVQYERGFSCRKEEKAVLEEKSVNTTSEQENEIVDEKTLKTTSETTTEQQL